MGVRRCEVPCMWEFDSLRFHPNDSVAEWLKALGLDVGNCSKGEAQKHSLRYPVSVGGTQVRTLPLSSWVP